MSNNESIELADYFSGCLYFSLSKLQRHINKWAEDIFSELNLSASHAFLLMAIAEQPRVGASHLSEQMGLAPSTVTRLIDKLVEKGFCIRVIAGRKSEVELSSTGQNLIPEIQRCWTKLLHKYNEMLGEEEATSLNRAVVQLNTNLSR